MVLLQFVGISECIVDCLEASEVGLIDEGIDYVNQGMLISISSLISISFIHMTVN